MKVGKQKDTNYWIKECLFSGEKKLGDIRKYLKGKEIIYANTKGLSLRLNNLIEKGIIGKHRSKENAYPTYYIQKKELEKTSFQAHVFANHASRKLLLNPTKSMKGSSIEEEFVKKMITDCGFYVMYSMLQGWKKSLAVKQPNRQRIEFEDWTHNVFPMPYFPTFFHRQISKMIDPDDKLQLSKSTTSYSELRKQQLEIIELELDKLFPEEMKLCNFELEKLDETSQKVFEDIIEFENEN